MNQESLVSQVLERSLYCTNEELLQIISICNARLADTDDFFEVEDEDEEEE